MSDDARQLRNRQAVLSDAIGRQKTDEDAPNSSCVAVIVGGWAPGVPRGPFQVKRAKLTGGVALGDVLVSEPIGGAFTATNLGSTTPPNPNLLADSDKTVVLLECVGGQHFFTYL